MAKGGQELEVKLYISNLKALRQKLESLGANLTHPQKLETNLRFDTAKGDLSRSYRVLRLRRYVGVQVTYKGPSEFVEGVRTRQEIEFAVGDFEATRDLFEALGYQVVLAYEKMRAVYDLVGVEVSLDELPYGSFIEIEGPDADSIRATANKLGLNWEARISGSYSALFEKLRQRLDLPFNDLTFRNFEGLNITADDLGVRPADKH